MEYGIWTTEIEGEAKGFREMWRERKVISKSSRQ